MTQLPADPYDAAIRLQSRCRKMEMTYIEFHYKYSQEIVQIAYKFGRNREAWDGFCNDDFWQDEARPPNPEDASKAILYLFKYTYGKGDNNRKRASHHSRGVRALLDDGVKRNKIAEELKERGGWSKVVNDSVAARKSKDIGVKAEGKAASKSEERPHEKVIKAISNEYGLIAVEFNGQRFKKMMQHQTRESCWLRVKCMGADDDGYVHFKALEVSEE